MSWKKKFAALVLFHLAIIFFLLFYDERLNPAIPTFLNRSNKIVEDHQNAFFAFVGFDAEQGKDIHTTGKMIVDKFADEITKNQLLDEFDRDALLGQKLAFKEQDVLKGSDGRFTYFPNVMQKKPTIQELLAVNQSLVRRYAALYDYSFYHETTPCSPASLFITYANIRNTHKLILWKIALDVQEGNTAAALNRLRRDTVFWRMNLLGAQDLITKLVAINAARQNYQLMSEILVYRPYAVALLSANDPLLKSLTSSEEDISASMRREFEFNIYSIKQTKHDLWKGKDRGTEGGAPNRFLAATLKVNSSTNMLYDDFSFLAKIAALPAREFAIEAEKLEKNRGEKLGCEILYNLMGTIVYELGGGLPTSGYINYIRKVHDLNGYISLINLQVQARHQEVEEEEMQDFLDRADPVFTNPYTGEPMQWDGEKKSVYFESMAQKGEETRRVELLL